MILVVGASGIIGQYLRLHQPPAPGIVYTSRAKQLPGDEELKLESVDDVVITLDRWCPDVVINLAGENRPDVVERDPEPHEFINVLAPEAMAEWCFARRKWLIHASTQGVLGGREAPYHEGDPFETTDAPVNKYGDQKWRAERAVRAYGAIVARITFVLGIRPVRIGRANPLEQMLDAAASGRPQSQVGDRYFSMAWAWDVATTLWEMATSAWNMPPNVLPRLAGQVFHLGTPERLTRYQIARAVAKKLEGDVKMVAMVLHDDAFPVPQWAPRPFDTTYDQGQTYPATTFREGLDRAITTWRAYMDYLSDEDRAKEIALFLRVSEVSAIQRLLRGFGEQHHAVKADFEAANPKTDDELLAWYRRTEAYIWELTCYHLDGGFNYFGMVQGITEHLKAKGKSRVLCIGDGVGDLTMKCKDAGLEPIYHDLMSSRTGDFAYFRAKRRFGGQCPEFHMSITWDPPEDIPPQSLDAVVALDFFEHMPNVEAWVRWCYDRLKPGGLFMAQNAFGIGNEPGGSLPMHLPRNNRFEKDWDPLMDSIGYVRTGEGNWRVKP